MSASHEPMETVLADAQRLGYAEADPSADVDGHDAAAKKQFINCHVVGRIVHESSAAIRAPNVS